MTTDDVLLGAVQVLGIMHFFGNTINAQINESAWSGGTAIVPWSRSTSRSSQKIPSL